jgi:hypothetical protein
MMANAKFMKLKPSPFIVLFLSLNSILIFCATRKADAKKNSSTGLEHAVDDSPLSPGDNFDALTNDPSIKNAKLTASAVSYYIGYMIHNKE